MPTYYHDPKCECQECCRAARAVNVRLKIEAEQALKSAAYYLKKHGPGGQAFTQCPCCWSAIDVGALCCKACALKRVESALSVLSDPISPVVSPEGK